MAPSASQAPGGLTRRLVWATFAALGAVLCGYLVVLLTRGSDHRWVWLDGWTVCALEIVAASLCIARGIHRHANRVAFVVLGAALMAWALGDVLLTAESLGGASPSTPSFADLFYLAFYPLAYVGTVLLIRNAMTQHLSKPNWLDGAVAGLGAAAVCAAFAFHSLLGQLGDTSGAVATNLSYPIGDLLVLSLVIGGTVVLSGRWSLPWLLLTAGITLNVVGDTFNLFQASEYSTRLGSTFNAIAWPTSILLIAMSVWLRPQVR
ncbi:MAG TPA: hypothetical protein VIE15_04740, partial [Acidimicrobiales bacterium]